MKLTSTIWLLNLMLFCLVVCHVWAEAPKTAKIAFASTRNGTRDIYLMNPDGSQSVNLTRDFADDLDPVWSPTGKKILFVSDRNGMRDLYLMNPDGENVRQMFKKLAHREDPTWSPDGKRIAYVRGKVIYIATLGKQTETPIVNGFSPTWSPDGTEIAFAVGVFGDSRLNILNLRTHKQKMLLPKETTPWQDNPAWSPDGDQIIFSWNKNPLPIPPGFKGGQPFLVPPVWLDKETIYLVNQDGTELRQIVKEAGPKAVWPVWSPHGDQIIYTQEIDNRRHLFKMDLVTRTPKQLTHTGQGHLTAHWFDPLTLPIVPQPQLLTITWGNVKK